MCLLISPKSGKAIEIGLKIIIKSRNLLRGALTIKAVKAKFIKNKFAKIVIV